jgi:hypothetical protein
MPSQLSALNHKSSMVNRKFLSGLLEAGDATLEGPNLFPVIIQYGLDSAVHALVLLIENAVRPEQLCQFLIDDLLKVFID